MGTSFGVTSCQTGAASAPPTPSANVVEQRSSGVASPRLTITAKAIEIAATAPCAPISRRRESTRSASAPAGTVRRNIGAMVATCTADTIIGSGLRLVISQLIEVSNIAMPTFDSELATRMTEKAGLAKTPQRDRAAGDGSASTVDGLVNRRSGRADENPMTARSRNGRARKRFQGASVPNSRKDRRDRDR